MISLLLSECVQMQVAGAGIQRETIDRAAALRKLCLTAIYNVSRSRHFCCERQAQLGHIKPLQVSSFYFRSTKIFNKSALPCAACQTPQSHLRLHFREASTCDFLSFLISSRCVYLFAHAHHTHRLKIFQSGLRLKLHPPQVIKGPVNLADCSAPLCRYTQL